MAEFFNENIPDRDHYNTEMTKSLMDKAFFIDKVDSSIFVDYGCGDGRLLAFIERNFPGTTVIGYDISQSELDEAAKVTKAELFSDWHAMKSHLNAIRGDRKATLICNSTVHEVYNYCNDREVAEFWDRIYGSGFDYVAIRDMCVSRTTSRPSDILSVAKVRQHFQDEDKLNQFEAEWGGLYENWSLTHFLLKFRYMANWEREVRENYLPINLETLLAKIPGHYTPIFMEHFTLPFIRQRVLEHFGIDLQDRTHLKLILKLV